MTPIEIFVKARDHGVALSLHGSEIRYKCSWKLPDELKAELTAHKADLIEWLAVSPEAKQLQQPTLWNTAEAAALINAADDLVEKLGISGLDPTIQAAAEYCIRAQREKNLDVVRSMCRRIEEHARELLSQKSNPGVRAT